MVARIRRLLAPPALADEDQARTARLLNTLLFLVLTLVLVSTPLWPLVYARPWPVLLAAGAAALLLVSCLFLLRRGSIRAVTWLFLATFWLIVSFVAVVSGGVHTTAFFTYGAIILLAGLLAGSWPAFLVAGLSSLAGLGMFFAQRYGLLPPPLLLDTPLSAWVALTVNFAVAAAVLHLATRSIAEALRRAHDNERALAGANEGLQREVAERRLAEEETRHHVDILTALHETALDLAAQRALPDLLRAITARAVDLLRAKGGAIYLYRPASDDLELMLTHRLEPDFSGAVLQRGEGLSGRVVESRKPMVVADYSRWEGRDRRFEAGNFAACVAVPILWSDRLLGVIDVLDDRPRTFSEGDIALLERFSPLAAAALENGRLVDSLQQQMEHLRQAQARLIQAARLAAIGELAAGVAHELNNPLTSILGFAELLLEESSADASIRADLETIVSEARRTRAIVHGLLDFARQSRPERRPADVNQLLQQTLAIIRGRLESGASVVEQLYDPEIGLVLMDPGQMGQVFLNLITNALEAMPRGGRLDVRTARMGDQVAISISDSGPGIPAELQERIFAPFFTTKPSGTGLGLSVSMGIVQEHGGRITVSSEAGRGSTFTVWLPLERSGREVGNAR